MICRALREYEAVTAETTFADGSTRTAIDVRRFSWIRPLAGDYAFDFANVAPLYAGDPSTRHAWTEAIARTRGMTRPRAAVAGLLAAQQERRGAPPAARAAAGGSPTQTVAVVTGQQAGAFGGPLFTLLKAITAIQLARNTAREQQAEVVPVFWVDAEDHDWDEVASCTVLDPASSRARSRCPSPRARASDRSPRSSWTAASSTVLMSSPARSARPSSREAHGLASRRLPARRSAWPTRSPGGSKRCSGRTGWSCSTRRIPRPSRSSPTCSPRARRRRPHRGARRGRGRRAHRPRTSAAGRAAARQRGALPSRRRAPADPPPGRPFRRRREHVHGRRAGRAGPNGAEPLQPERAAAADRAGHALPHHLLRGRAERARVPRPAPRRVRQLRRPDAAHVSARDSDARRFGDGPLPRPLRRPVEDLQRQDESALNRLLESQLPQSVEQAIRDAEAAMRRTMERVIDAMPAVDPTLAGAAKTTLSKMEHDLAGCRAR